MAAKRARTESNADEEEESENTAMAAKRARTESNADKEEESKNENTHQRRPTPTPAAVLQHSQDEDSHSHSHSHSDSDSDSDSDHEDQRRLRIFQELYETTLNCIHTRGQTHILQYLPNHMQTSSYTPHTLAQHIAHTLINTLHTYNAGGTLHCMNITHTQVQKHTHHILHIPYTPHNTQHNILTLTKLLTLKHILHTHNT